MGKGEVTRGAIVAQALSLASRGGLEGVTIGALAEQVGMSKSGLFAHFASRENLEVAILDEAVRRFIEIVVVPALKKPRGEPRVRALLERWLEWPKQDFQPGGCIFVAAGAELDDKPGAPRDRLVAAQRDWVETIATAARIAVDEGHFRKDLDVAQFALEAFSLAYGFHYVNRLLCEPTADQRVRRAFASLVERARCP